MSCVREYNWDVERKIQLIHMKITSSKTSVQCIFRIIEACVVLHNYLIEENDNVLDDWRDDFDISDVDDTLSDNDELNNPVLQLWP